MVGGTQLSDDVFVVLRIQQPMSYVMVVEAASSMARQTLVFPHWQTLFGPNVTLTPRLWRFPLSREQRFHYQANGLTRWPGLTTAMRGQPRLPSQQSRCHS